MRSLDEDDVFADGDADGKRDGYVPFDQELALVSRVGESEDLEIAAYTYMNIIH